MARDEELEDIVGELLDRVVEALGLDADVDVLDDGVTITGTVEGDDVGLLIGHHGQTIDAVQHLATRFVLGDGSGPRRRVVIDAAGYRERRRVALIGMADDAADEALAKGAAVSLAPMSAGERRVVHEHLRDRGGFETHSEGEEPERFLVVEPAA